MKALAARLWLCASCVCLASCVTGTLTAGGNGDLFTASLDSRTTSPISRDMPEGYGCVEVSWFRGPAEATIYDDSDGTEIETPVTGTLRAALVRAGFMWRPDRHPRAETAEYALSAGLLAGKVGYRYTHEGEEQDDEIGVGGAFGRLFLAAKTSAASRLTLDAWVALDIVNLVPFGLAMAELKLAWEYELAPRWSLSAGWQGFSIGGGLGGGTGTSGPVLTFAASF